ncbi:nuclear transport factor 2 family protein [Halomonas qinghailakensis]|uniref:Nuclear transport factor 2 family protein n=1 Tax=Halomonas qinghailakensis TaxID=2937790 RepID=A0AA46TSS3_9GAMM|nr:nuclear transport factor 2 family protein [Halomonas sp. ZZQ-149]UYO74897.1 nuclear transport factor 2 family protein [Halomonas sp. ZZQ-149]
MKLEKHMNRRAFLTIAVAGTAAAALSTSLSAKDRDDKDKASFDTVMAFMGAMGGGDMDTLDELMAGDMVWQNEGDPDLPWIGTWEGKEAIFGFLGMFSENVQVTHWENQDAFASGDTVAVFGRMKLRLSNSGVETDEFTFALRAKVRNGQVVFWNWFEDSYAVSQAFHAT